MREAPKLSRPRWHRQASGWCDSSGRNGRSPGNRGAIGKGVSRLKQGAGCELVAAPGNYRRQRKTHSIDAVGWGGIAVIDRLRQCSKPFAGAVRKPSTRDRRAKRFRCDTGKVDASIRDGGVVVGDGG